MKIIRIAKLNENEEFQQWFKGSKIVGKDGKPLEVYHGTSFIFEKFKLSNGGLLGPGIYLTADPTLAKMYANHNENGIMSLYLKIINPYFVKDKEDYRMLSKMAENEKEPPRSFLAKQGYDGIIDNYGFGHYGTTFVAFLPSQIRKSPNQRSLNEFKSVPSESKEERERAGLPPREQLIPYDQFSDNTNRISK